MTEKIDNHVVATHSRATAKKTKSVRNRSGHRVELSVNGKIVVFLPGKITEVPADFEIPSGLGLYVR